VDTFGQSLYYPPRHCMITIIISEDHTLAADFIIRSKCTGLGNLVAAGSLDPVI